MPSVAIVGTEASGKTVFITCLARRYRDRNAQGVFIEPLTGKSAEYVNKNWERLNNSEWPPSTPPGDYPELRWRVHFGERSSCDLQLIDAPGQDLRQIFGLEPERCPEHLRSRAEYVRDADVVLFLFNLKDALSVRDDSVRTENQWVIKSAMDMLVSSSRPRRFCLILTQADKYEAEFKKFDNNLRDLVKQHLPELFAAHLADGDVPIFVITAVGDVKIVDSKLGKPRHVPKPDFKSRGFLKLMGWLKSSLPSGPTIEIEITPSPTTPPVPPPPPPRTGWQLWVIAGVVSVLLWRGCVSGCATAPTTTVSPPTTPAALPTKPVPVIVEHRPQSDPGLFFDAAISRGKVRNDGVFGKVIVEAWAIENGTETDRQSQTLFLNRGETANFEIKLRVRDLRNKPVIYATAVAP